MDAFVSCTDWDVGGPVSAMEKAEKQFDGLTNRTLVGARHNVSWYKEIRKARDGRELAYLHLKWKRLNGTY